MNDVFLAVPPFAGSGGMFYSIGARTKDSYQDVGFFYSRGKIVFHEPVNYWLQIEVMSRGGYANFTRLLYAYHGQKYAVVRNEGHDLVKHEVKIRTNGK